MDKMFNDKELEALPVNYVILPAYYEYGEEYETSIWGSMNIEIEYLQTPKMLKFAPSKHISKIFLPANENKEI